jgi:hypothetical protein
MIAWRWIRGQRYAQIQIGDDVEGAGAQQPFLLGVVADELRSRGLELDTEARPILEELTRAADQDLQTRAISEQLSDEQRVAAEGDPTGTAADNARRFVAELDQLAGPDRVVTADMITDTLSKLCPIWPFCRTKR